MSGAGSQAVRKTHLFRTSETRAEVQPSDKLERVDVANIEVCTYVGNMSIRPFPLWSGGLKSYNATVLRIG